MYRTQIPVSARLPLGCGISPVNAGSSRRARTGFEAGTIGASTARGVALGTALRPAHGTELMKNDNSSAPQFVARDAASGLHSWKPPV